MSKRLKKSITATAIFTLVEVLLLIALSTFVMYEDTGVIELIPRVLTRNILRFISGTVLFFIYAYSYLYKDVSDE